MNHSLRAIFQRISELTNVTMLKTVATAVQTNMTVV